MFQKSDKPLKILRIITDVLFWLTVVGCFIGAIVLFTFPWLWWVGLLLLLFGPFAAYFVWQVPWLILSFLYDVKMIRNKLYGIEDNTLRKVMERGLFGWAKIAENQKPAAGMYYGAQQPPVAGYGAPQPPVAGYGATQKNTEAEVAIIAARIDRMTELRKMRDAGKITEEQYQEEVNKLSQ